MFGARAWWMLDLARTESELAQGPRSYANEVPAGMEAATDQVVQMLAEMQDTLGVSDEHLIVGGFSQGSMAACNAVFTRDVTPAALVILPGTPVNLPAWKAGMLQRPGLRVLQSHGDQDPLLFKQRKTFATRCARLVYRPSGSLFAAATSFRCRCSTRLLSSSKARESNRPRTAGGARVEEHSAERRCRLNRAEAARFDLHHDRIVHRDEYFEAAATRRLDPIRRELGVVRRPSRPRTMGPARSAPSSSGAPHGTRCAALSMVLVSQLTSKKPQT